MAHFMTDDSRQFVIRRHVVDQALEQVDIPAGNRQGVDLLGIQNLKCIGQVFAIRHRDNAGAQPGHPRLKRRIVDQAVFFLQIVGDALADLDFLFRADEQGFRRRGRDNI